MAEITNYVTPTRLYRYRSLEDFDREIAAIKDGYLFCASYRDLNDPMEGVFTSSRSFRKSENYNDIKRELRNKKTQIGICSFSEVHNHELMWAHYADQFRGICIGYSLRGLRKNLPQEISFVRMFYDEDGPTVHLTRKSPIELAKMVLSYKNYRWLHEREWRMFATPGKAWYNNLECVATIYFGFRLAKRNRRRIKEELGSSKIQFQNMSLKKYAMDFEIDH